MIAQLTFDCFMHSFAECTPLQCSVMRIVVADLLDVGFTVDHFLRSAFCVSMCLYICVGAFSFKDFGHVIF